MAIAVFKTYSIYLNLEMHKNIGQVYDSVAHEICHLLVTDEEDEHGPKWKEMALRFGASIENYE